MPVMPARRWEAMTTATSLDSATVSRGCVGGGLAHHLVIAAEAAHQVGNEPLLDARVANDGHDQRLASPAGSHDHRPYPERCLPAFSGARVRAGRGSHCLR